MAGTKRRESFYESEEGASVREALELMTKDKRYNTKSSYSANITQYPNHRMPFVDKHMSYLNLRADVDAKLYLSNLRLKTKIR